MINASERVKGTLGDAGSFMKYVCSYDVRDSTSSGHKTGGLSVDSLQTARLHLETMEACQNTS